MKSKDKPKRMPKKAKKNDKTKPNKQALNKTTTESKPINPWLYKYFKMD